MKLPFFKPRQERVRLQAAELAEDKEELERFIAYEEKKQAMFTIHQ